MWVRGTLFKHLKTKKKNIIFLDCPTELDKSEILNSLEIKDNNLSSSLEMVNEPFERSRFRRKIFKQKYN